MRPEVKDLCERLGLVFGGPDPAVKQWMHTTAAEHPPVPAAAASNGHVGVRRLAVPIAADGHGTVWPLGVSDCSCERRGEAILAESASTALTADQERDIMDAAQRLARDAGYCGAGTVEFLYEPETRRFYPAK